MKREIIVKVAVFDPVKEDSAIFQTAKTQVRDFCFNIEAIVNYCMFAQKVTDTHIHYTTYIHSMQTTNSLF